RRARRAHRRGTRSGVAAARGAPPRAGRDDASRGKHDLLLRARRASRRPARGRALSPREPAPELDRAPRHARAGGEQPLVRVRISKTGRFLLGLLPGKADLVAMRRAPGRDLLAGLTVAIVALPLALAFGVASGLGATAGL